jgi:hypothetical protein
MLLLLTRRRGSVHSSQHTQVGIEQEATSVVCWTSPWSAAGLGNLSMARRWVGCVPRMSRSLYSLRLTNSRR